MAFSKQTIAVALAFALLLGLTGCTGEPAAQLSSPTSELPTPVGGLPQLPADRAGSDLTEYLLAGTATFQRSANVSESGSSIVLDSTAAVPAWAIYGFDPLGDPLDSFHISIDVPEGSEAWLALADYSLGRWEMHGPFEKSSTVAADNERHLSPAGVFYAAVIAQGSAPSTVSACSVRTITANNTAPMADISAAPLSGNTPLNVDFNASASSDAEDNIARYLWDFDGDGFFEGLTTNPTASFTYTAGGSYQATLRVEDSAGAFAVDQLAIEVNASPQAVLEVLPAVVERGESVSLDGALSSDSDGSIVKYEWDQDGDGTFEIDSAGTSTVTFTAESAGAFTLGLRITDDAGATTQASALLHVQGFLERQTVAEGPGLYTSLLLVNGNPALCYYGNDDGFLHYVRALDPNGSTWGARVTVDGSGFAGADNSLAIVDGRPAISYISYEADDLRYVRAADANGEAWGFAEILDNGEMGFSSLAVVAGQPAVAYYNWDSTDLVYTRATDAQGSDWGDPQTLDSENNTGFGPSLAVINGNPAVAYHNSTAGQLLYMRAQDAQGLSWDSPQLIEDFGSPGFPCKLLSVDEGPAIAYRTGIFMDVNYIRATDPNGLAWMHPVVIDSSGSPGTFLSMQIVNGRPAMAYFDENDDSLYYAEALNAAGTAWGNPVIADKADDPAVPGYYCSLIDLYGKPTIGHVNLDGDKVSFLRSY